MQTLKKAGRKVLYVLNVLLPCSLYVALFLSFIGTIILRYFFRKSLSWGNELAVLCYMWIMFFGTGKAMEKDEHVVFSLVYDKCSPKVQMIMKIVYNILLAVLVCIAFKPSLKLLLKSTMRTGVLKIPYKLAFAPFFWMLGEVIVRSLINVKKALDEYKTKVSGAIASGVSGGSGDPVVSGAPENGNQKAGEVKK